MIFQIPEDNIGDYKTDGKTSLICLQKWLSECKRFTIRRKKE